jgi:thiamine transport system permease protein
VSTLLPREAAAAWRRPAVRAVAAAIPLAFLGIFLFWPLVRILSLGLGPLLRGGVRALAATASAANVGAVLAASTAQALVSTVLSLLLALPVASVFARWSFPVRRWMSIVLFVPFVLPPVVVAAAFNATAGPGGLAQLAASAVAGHPVYLSFSLGLGAVIVAHVFYNISIIVRIVGDFWAGLDPRLEQAARALGAGKFAAFRTVTLRLLAPAIAAAALLVFCYCFTSFGIVLILGGPRVNTLETAIWQQAVQMLDLPAAALLSLIQLLVTGLVMGGYARLERRMSAALRQAPPRQVRRRPAGAGAKLMVGVFGWGLPLVVALPLAALAVGTFFPGGRFSLEGWTSLFSNVTGSLFWVSPVSAARTSLLYAVATVGLSLAVGLPAAYLVSGTRGREGRRSGAAGGILDLAILLPLGTSALTLGFGFLVSLDRPPFDLRASPLLVPIAHALVALPLVTRSLAAPLAALDNRLREASGLLGANPVRTWLTVDLPILGRAISSAAVFAFTVSLGEFAATALLARPQQATITLAIYNRLGLPGELNRAQALAMSTVLMVACALGVAALERMRARQAD